MSADTLRPILAAYRAEVQPHWSAATAHPDYDGAAGSPVGQCGVTSAWVQRRLAEDHGIKTRFILGTLFGSENSEEPLDLRHCWLEFDALPGVLEPVIDLTADQYGAEPVICESWITLIAKDIWYCHRSSRSIEQLADDPVQPRLAILTEAVGR